MNQPADDIILEARAITKRYPGTLALDGVTLRVHRNQVNVLIGENGAGKSTLMRILAGVEVADEGELLLDGSRIRIRSPRDAAAHGISIVHQELSVLPNLDISENIFAGRELTQAAVLLDRSTEPAQAHASAHQGGTTFAGQSTDC
jgi:erythritol transport system ATP-binding protein